MATTSKKIFLVHGRDVAAKNQIARFVERSLQGDASVTILDEQANSGRTLIEKFQDHADESAYAVVLLTPDDIGGPTGDDTNLVLKTMISADSWKYQMGGRLQ